MCQKTHAAIEKAQELSALYATNICPCGLERMYEWYKNEYLLIMPHKRSHVSEVYILKIKLEKSSMKNKYFE